MSDKADKTAGVPGEDDHGPFIAKARSFRRQLHDSGGFTPPEIAAMLGAFVLTMYRQFFQVEQVFPPEFYEMMTKHNALSDRALAEGDDE